MPPLPLAAGLLTLLLAAPLTGCQSGERAIHRPTPPTDVPVAAPAPPVPVPDWRIRPHQVGPFRIGHSIREYAAVLQTLAVDSVDPWPWGIDGPGSALLIRHGTDSLLTLVPYDDTDSIIFISLLTPAIPTESGIRVGTSVGELLRRYPDLRVTVDDLFSNEFSFDPANGWRFEFFTDSTTSIGRYATDRAGSSEKAVPVNLKPRIGRIIVD